MGHSAALAETLPDGQARPRVPHRDRPEDRPLVEALRAHDPEALEELENRYGRMILAWARSEGADAEDVLQDVLMRVWRSCHRLDPESSLPAWLKVITKNVLRNRWKSRARRPEILSGLEPTERETVDPTAEARSRIAVDQLLGTLHTREQDALRMLYLSDLSLKEVAERLEISEEATKSLAARARRRLRANLGRLVASSPASTMYLLVGRAAEAATTMAKPLGALGAAAAATAAATAITAGSVAVHRDLEPAPAPPAVHAEAPEGWTATALHTGVTPPDHASWTRIEHAPTAGQPSGPARTNTDQRGEAHTGAEAHGPGNDAGQSNRGHGPGDPPGQAHGPGHGQGTNPGQGQGQSDDRGQGRADGERAQRDPGGPGQAGQGGARSGAHGQPCDRSGEANHGRDEARGQGGTAKDGNPCEAQGGQPGGRESGKPQPAGGPQGGRPS